MTMKSVDLPHLRSVVMAGHVGSGKTTLSEQLLFKAGAIPRLGRVDDGTAHLDFEPEEQKRRESLSLAVGTFESDANGQSALVGPEIYPVAASLQPGCQGLATGRMHARDNPARSPRQFPGVSLALPGRRVLGRQRGRCRDMTGCTAAPFDARGRVVPVVSARI